MVQIWSWNRTGTVTFQSSHRNHNISKVVTGTITFQKSELESEPEP
jgi:hypothetical protein